MRIEMANKLFALSDFLTLVEIDGKSDPIATMAKSDVLLGHQDQYLIAAMLQENAQIFERALLWDKKDIQDLKNQVALFRYLFAHAMPFSRGSAAVGEWLEKAIYQYQGYHCKHNPSLLGDCEALTASWSTFAAERYAKTITLTSAL
jgi:hypothetical protein